MASEELSFYMTGGFYGQGVGLVGREQMYRQCTLTKQSDGGTAYMVTWVRAELAKTGLVIDRLEDSDTGRIESGWKVLSVGDPTVAASLLIKRSRDYKKTRVASDI